MSESNPNTTDITKKRNDTEANMPPIISPDGLTGRYIIVPQLLNGGAFLSALFSSSTCEFIKVKYDYDWTSGASWTKDLVQFGMLSRETADVDSDSCFWYTQQDFAAFFDNPFKTAVVANVLSTLIGAVLFIYSLFLWCRLVTRNSIKFLCYINAICILGGLLSQLVFFSSSCSVDECTTFYDGSQYACVHSYCTPGAGSYFSMMAITLWTISSIATFYLLVKADKQIQLKSFQRQRQDAEHSAQDVEKGHIGQNLNSTYISGENLNYRAKAEEYKEGRTRHLKKDEEISQRKPDKSNEINIKNEGNISDKIPSEILITGGKPSKKLKLYDSHRVVQVAFVEERPQEESKIDRKCI